MGLLDQIISVESGGNPNARNPRSSAAGLGQFIDATWLDMLRRHRPDITGSREELLALKTNPDLSKAMTDAYAKDNGAILSGAGLSVTPGSTYLAHFAGPQGAVNVLKADPNTPVSAILRPEAIAANPFLRGMTAGGLAAWADKKMGGATAPQAAAPQKPYQAPPQQAQAAALPPVFPMVQPQPAPFVAQPMPQQQQEPQRSYFDLLSPVPPTDVRVRPLKVAAISQRRGYY